MKLLIWGQTPFAAYLAAQLATRHEVDWLADQTGNLPAAPPDLILLAGQAWATADFIIMLRQALPWDQSPPPMVVLQNGYGSIQRIESVFGAGHTLAAAITRPFWYGSYQAGKPNLSHILSAEWGGVALQADHALSETVANMLRQIGLEVQMGFAESIQWSSVFWGLQANAISSILDITPQAVYQSSQWFPYEHAQLKEAMRVIKAMNVKLMPLPGVNVPRIAQIIERVPYKLAAPLLSVFPRPPSLRDDLRWQTGRSDAAYFNGAIAALGHNLRLRTPINHALALVLTDLAEGRARWERYRNKPDLLEASLRIAIV